MARRETRSRVAAGLALVLLSGTASAQVNVERLTRRDPRAGWAGQVEGSLALSAGNVDLVDAGAAASLHHHTLHGGGEASFRSRLVVVVNRRFGSVDGRRFSDRGFAHLRWTRMIRSRLGLDVFAQHQSDAFTRLERRVVGGFGVRAEIVPGAEHRLWAGSGYMIELERVDVRPEAPDERDTLNHRLTNYLALSVALAPRASLQSTTYLQPRFDAFSDWRLLESVDVGVELNRRFTLGLELEIQRDSRPPAGVEKVDFRLRNSLRLRF